MSYNLLRGCYSIILMTVLLAGVTSESKALDDVNSPPYMTGYIGNRTVAVEDSISINLEAYFHDSEDGDDLHYSHNNASPNLVTYHIDNDNNVLTIYGGESTGTTSRILVTATDGGNLTVQQDFNVAVTAEVTPQPLNISVTPSTISENAGEQTVTVRATPGGSSSYDIDQTITVRVTGSGGVDYEPSISLFSFTLEAGSMEASDTLTITPEDDLVDRSNTIVTVSANATPSNGSDTETITLTDDDTRGILVSKTSVSMRENGSTDTYFVWLATEPTANVTVAVSSKDESAAMVTPTTLAYTRENWNEEYKKTVTVTGVDDPYDNENNKRTPKIENTGSGGDYSNERVDVIAMVIDDDPEITISVDDDEVTEGDSVTITVMASTPPRNNLSVGLMAGGATEVISGRIQDNIQIDAGTSRTSFTVDINENNIHEANKTFTVSLVGNAEYRIGDESSVSVKVINDDDPPVLSIADASLSEGTSGTKTMSFTLTLSGSATRSAVNANWRTYDGTATVSDDDYESSNGSVSFSLGVSGSRTQSVSVTINGDTFHESDETFEVRLSGVNIANVVDNTGEGTIENDDDPPVLSIADASLSEGTSGTKTMSFTLTLSGSATRSAVNANWRTYDGTATVSDDDYESSNGSVSFSPGVSGSRTQSVSVTINGDTFHESDETFEVRLSGVNIANVVDNTGEGTIENDDDPPVLSIADASLSEGTSGTKTMSFTLTLSGSATRSAVNANWRTYDGTATVSDDDYESSNGSVSFSLGVSGSRTQSVSVTINGDTFHESDETFEVRLSGVNIANVVDNTGEGTIENDDDPPVLSIADASLSEGTSGTKTMSFTLTLSGSATRSAVNANWRTYDGTATVSDDDYESSNGSVSFSPGVSGSRTQSVSVTINGDTFHESDETFEVRLSGVNIANVVDNTGEGTIENDDDQPTSISLMLSSSRLSESAGATTIRITASVTNGSVFGQIQTVTVSVAGSGTTGAVGFESVDDFDVNIDAGEASGETTFTLTPVDNTDDNVDEEITLSGTVTPSGIPVSSATIDLTDDDVPLVKITAGTSPITEGSDAVFTLLASPVSAVDLSVDVSVNGAAHFLDGTVPRTESVLIKKGVSNAELRLATLDDNVHERSASVMATVQSGHGYEVGSESEAEVAINDNDIAPMGITLSVSHPSISEEDGGTEVTVTATLTGDASFDETQTVTVSVSGSGVDNAVGFNAVSDFDVIILGGDTSGDATFTLTPTDNALDNVDETVTLSGSASQSGLSVASVDITLSDDEELTITIAAVAESVAEGTPAVFTVSSSPAPAVDLSVIVEVSGAEGFLSGIVPRTETVVIVAGGSSASLSLDTVSNSVVESDASVTAVVSAGTGYVVGLPSSAEVMITDRPTPISITLSTSTSSVSESDGATEVTVTATLTSGAIQSADETVTVTVSGSGTAYTVGFEAVSDFDVIIGAGETSGTAMFTLTPFTNTDDNLDETITVSGIASPSGLPVVSASINLTDDDIPLITITAGTSPVTEGTSVEFSLTASPVPAVDLSVNVDVSGASGFLSGTVPRMETVSIEEWTSSGTLQITTVDDSTDEASAAVSATVASGTDYAVGGTATAEVTIEDNDDTVVSPPTGITLSLSHSEVSEGDGDTDVTVTATVVGGTFTADQTVTVSVSGSGLSSVVGFTNVPSFDVVITTDQVSGSASFTLSPVPNTVVNVDEAVTVSGTASPSGLTVTSATLKLVDDDAATTAPSARPEDFTAVEGNASLYLSWSPLAGASSYEFRYRIMGESTPFPWPWMNIGNVTSHALTGLENGKHYILRLRARNSFGFGPQARAEGTPDASTAPQVTISTSDVSLTEGSSATITVSASPAPTVPISVVISVIGGESFITGQIPASVTIGSDQSSGSFTLVTADDVVDEPSATVTASISTGSGYAVGTTDSVQVRIDDNDDAPSGIALTVVPDEIVEDAGSTTVTVTATPTGGTRFATEQTVSAMISAGGGANAVSYTSVNTLQVTISAGAASGSNTFALMPTENTVSNASETVTLSGTASPSGATVTPATITLTDDDGPEITIAAGTSPVDEGTAVTYTITASPAPVNALPVNLTVIGGDNYLTGTKPTSVTIEAETTETVVTLETEDDVVDEQSDVVTATVTSGFGYRVGTNKSAQITVNDNDDPPTGIDLSMVPTTASEGDSLTVVTVTAKPAGGTLFGAQQTVTVSVTGSGTSNAVGFEAVGDFDLTITAGATSGTATFDLKPVDNAAIDANETITVSGTASPSGVTVFSATLSLTDDDMPVITITAGSSPVTEGTAAVFTLTASPAPTAELTVNVEVNGAEGFLSDAPPASVVVIAASSATAALNLATDDDEVNEMSATVTVTVDSGTGYVVGSSSSAQVVIDDNDEATTLPGTPTNIGVTPGSGSLTISWDSVTGATSYEIKHRVKGEPEPVPWNFVNIGNVTNYTIANLQNSTKYIIRLIARNSLGVSQQEGRTTGTPSGTAGRTIGAWPAPAVVESLDDIKLEAGEVSTMDVVASFTGDGLTYSASVSNRSVATATVTDGELTVTGLSKGTTHITVTARNEVGTVGYTFEVIVTATVAEHAAYENVLSAMGRGLLSSARATMEDRFSAVNGQRHLNVAGRRVDGLASGVSALIGLSGHHIPQHWNDPLTAPSAVRVDVLRNSSFVYTMPRYGQAQNAGGLTLWGTGNVQAFRSSPSGLQYDGSLRTGYMGMDITMPGLVAGISVSRTSGSTGFHSAESHGELATRLTGVYPYARWQSASRPLEIWSILGAGRGAAITGVESRDLSMRMAMVGVRARWIDLAGLGVSVVGHAGALSLSALAGEAQTLGELSADVRQVRLGLEGSGKAVNLGASSLMPFAQVAGRYDGGAGESGSGVEIAGGLRLAVGRLGIEARGRFLAAHTASGYQERGLSLIAYVRPSPSRGGLSVTVAPRWGDDTKAVDMTWREDASIEPGRKSSEQAGTVRAQVGYSLLYPALKGLVVTPFGEADLTASNRRMMRVGTRMGSQEGMMSLELAGERRQDRSGDDHRLGILARMRF